MSTVTRRRQSVRGALHAHPVALGAVIAGVLLALTLLAVFSTNGVPGVSRYELTTTLPRDAPPVRTGSEVRVGGLVMGLVSAVAPTASGQRVTFGLKGAAQPVGRDVRITMRLRSPAGQHYLAVDRGNYRRHPLPSGVTIPPGHVTRTEDLLDVIEGFNKTAVANLATTTRFTGLGFAARGKALNASLAGLDASLRQNTGIARAATPGNDATGLLREADRTFKGFAGRLPTDPGRVTTASARTFGAFAEERAAIGAGLRELRPAEDELSRTLPVADRTLAATTELARRLTPATRALRRALPDASALFAEGRTLRDESARIAAAGEPSLSRLAPPARAFAPSALMIGLAVEPLGALTQYLSRYGPELESGFSAFYGALNYLNSSGLAPKTPAAPAMFVLTCATGSDIDPAPGQLFADKLEKPCA